MKGKAAFLVGAGVGYLFGTRAGRAQYEKIKAKALDAWHDPKVQGYVHDAEDKAVSFAKEQGTALKEKVTGSSSSDEEFSGLADDDTLRSHPS